DEPISISNSWNDYMGGLHATVGILQALARRAKTGVGMNLDLAQFECSVATVGPLLLASAVNGEAPTRLGNRSTSVAPQGCYRCAGRDEWCVISVQTDEQWRALLDVMEANGRFREPDFATVLGRLARHDEIDRAIESWTSELAKEEVERRLRAAGVPAERMRRANEVLETGEGERVFAAVEDPPGHPIRATALPLAFGASSITPIAPAPRVGEHTDAVLRDWLGLADGEIERLAADE